MLQSVTKLQSGMDAVSPNQNRFYPERFPTIYFAGHHLDNQWLKDDMQLNMSSVVRFLRGPEKTAESDIVLAKLHTDATLILVTSD